LLEQRQKRERRGKVVEYLSKLSLARQKIRERKRNEKRMTTIWMGIYMRDVGIPEWVGEKRKGKEK
jgi:hypothetical protein